MTLTIYDIARLADVSPSTVSRALNGKPGVSRKNRDAINQIVRQYNFQTPVSNPDASLNKEQRVVGILTDDLDSDHQNDAVAKCQGELLINGYQCISKFIGDDDDAMERSLAEMADKQVSGLLLIGDAFLDHERLKEAIKRWVPDTPIVLVYQNQRIGELPNVYCVGPNERKGFAYCVQRMYERGRRNIALVIEEGRTGEKKIQEYFEQSVKQYPDVNTAVFTQVPYSVSGGKDIAFQVLRQLPDVDGVLCTRDKTAIGLMYYMEDTRFFSRTHHRKARMAFQYRF